MLFSSIPFLYYFLPAVLLCYFCVPKRFKNAVLLVFSLTFYAWGEPVYIALMAVSIVFAYAEGRLIGAMRTKPAARAALAGSVAVHLALLLYFKYADFFIGNLNALGAQVPYLHVVLPIGISFYTFQILSYLIDAYRKDCEAERNIIAFGVYVSMFPQLIAGPIVRYHDIARELRERTHSIVQAATGARLFVIGLAKKVLVANTLGEICAAFYVSQDLSVAYVWLYALSFTLQIYFDFSGYSDMARGLGCIFGFRFPVNFRHPLWAESITDFWRRWHITLGSWFRDYVYIPLGGNRVSKPRWIFNIAVVWFLTGMWHGAAWNFALWGLFFAVFLVVEKVWLGKLLAGRKVLSHAYVMVAVAVSFVIFDASDGAEALLRLQIMFTGAGLDAFSPEFWYCLRSYAVVLVAALVGATPLLAAAVDRVRSSSRGAAVLNVCEPVFLAALLLMCTAFILQDSYNPFLYFRF